MSAIPEPKANPDGLHQRYKVTKTSGEPTDPMATYFVLRLDGMGRDGLHVAACRAAARAYSQFIDSQPEETHLDKVAEQLETLVNNLESAGA